MHILLSKIGQGIHTGTALGEVRQTDGIAEHLVEQGHDVTYFGHCKDPMPCRVVIPHTQGLTDLSTGAAQREGFRADIDELGNEGFDVAINIAGYAGTMALIDNPNGAAVQVVAIRNTAPILNAIMHYDCPRIIINTDQRTYPKEQEMSLVNPRLIPVALLDQWDLTLHTVIGGVTYRRESIYAGVERWATYPKQVTVPRTRLCTLIGHAHIATSNAGWEAQDVAWQVMLNGMDYEVYGKGWEYYSRYKENDRFMGAVPMRRAFELFQESHFCPMTHHNPANFYTGKIWVCISHGCAPLLYTGNNCTYDPFYRFLPHDSKWRVRQMGDVKRIIEQDPQELLKALTIEADWSALDGCLDALPDCEGYGGYTRCD